MEEIQDDIEVNTSIYKIGNDTESENFGNGSFLKHTTNQNGKLVQGIYLKNITFYFLRKSYLKAIQLTFFNNNTKEVITTNPKIFGILGSLNQNSVIDEIYLDLDQDEQINQVDGNLSNKRINYFEIHTTKGKFIKLGGENEEDFFNNYNNKNVKKIINSKFSNDESELRPINKKEKSIRFHFEFLTNGKVFGGFNIGWNSSGINFIDFLYTNKSVNYIEKKYFHQINKELADESYNVYNLEESSSFVYKSELFGSNNIDTCLENDFIKLVNKLNKEVGYYHISFLTVYYDKYINCIEIEYSNSSGTEKIKFAHTGRDGKIYNNKI